ncbi:MAG TPA: 3-isopropylmalate dehydratase small subunit [Paracoccus sp.]|nr:3-isopropylmalate dehydratase small subunit [Paracoccus sp. (in: a-proteobacteria)]
MKAFTVLTAIAAPLPESQIDTDVIFPARFLLLAQKSGLGSKLFHERRAQGGFVLDTPPWNVAQILVAGPDFGTGSSRENAVWALSDFGIRCVIAPGFGEIFQANCFRNGVLPIVLQGEAHARVLAEAGAGRALTIDLPAQRVRMADGVEFAFEVAPDRKHALIEGLDEIGLILKEDIDEIDAFEARHRRAYPWLFLDDRQLAHFDDAAACD